MKCDFIKPDGEKCRAIALSNSKKCRHHHVSTCQVVGHIDRRLVDEEPGSNPAFFDDYNTEEIHNYVRNATGGRVLIPMNIGHDRMVSQAVEVLS